MPRKLLRVALVAAVIPALTPVMSFAQTARPATTARQSATTPAPKQSLSWWQRLRGQKASTAEKPLPSTKLPPGVKPGPASAASKTAANNLTKRPAPTAAKVAAAGQTATKSRIQRVSGQTSATKPVAEFEQPQELLNRPLITPTSQATIADFENAFPDDTQTTRRGRPAVVPQAAPQAQVAAPVADDFADFQEEMATPVQQEVAGPITQTEVATPVADVATPVANEQAPIAEAGTENFEQASATQSAADFEADAFPIDQAAPPQDLTAGYNEPQGAVPQYDYVGMLQQGNAGNEAQFTNPVPARPIANAMNGMRTPAPVKPVPVPVGAGGPVGFVRLDGGMYPCPQPHIPYDVGTTMITNPALDPHEMLYAHRYRGLYGPFYYKTYRHWVMTPFGVCKNEKRVLVGTEVRVNYKSHICPFSLYFPPVTH